MKPILRKIFTLIVLSLVFWLLQNNQILALQRPTPPLKPTPPTKPTPPVFSFKIPCPPKKPTPPAQFRANHQTSPQPHSILQHPCDLVSSLEDTFVPETPPDSNEVWIEQLSQLLVNDITQTFSTESIQSAIKESNEQIGKMTKLELVSDLTLTDDWAQGEFLAETDQGVSQRFLVVFHKENDAWKLFGTRLF